MELSACEAFIGLARTRQNLSFLGQIRLIFGHAVFEQLFKLLPLGDIQAGFQRAKKILHIGDRARFADEPHDLGM